VVKREMHVNVDGEDKVITVQFATRDWASMEAVKLLGLEHPQWLVAYDKEQGCALIDWMAPLWYMELASLHEMICVGGCYQDLVPDLDDSDHHCEAVELFILSIAGEHREEYIRARHAMFNDVLGHNACAPDMRQRMMHTLVMLEQQGVKF